MGLLRWSIEDAAGALLVVIPRLQKIDARRTHAIYPTMLLRNPPRPAACQHKSQRLGFADPRERVPKNGVHQIQNSKRNIALGADPGTKIR